MSLYNPRNSVSPLESPRGAKCIGSSQKKALLLQVLFLLLALFCVPTIHAQDYSIETAPSPTPEAETRQATSAPAASGLPLQILRVDDIRMIISGVSTLSSTSQQTWAQTTINFVANAVGQALVQQTSGYVELALEMSTWTSSLTNDGNLEMDFGLTLNIKSSTTFSQANGRSMVLNSFDNDTEKFAYITALKNTGDTAFENAVDVDVTIDSAPTPTSTPPSPVETDPPTVAPTKQPTSAPVVEPTTEAPVATDAPTMSPTITTPDPTVGPTSPPTSQPSPPPGAPTVAPTLSPQPSTASPTAADTLPLQRFQAKNLVMVLEGMEPLILVAQSIWQDETAAFIKSEIGNMVSPEETVGGVSIDFTSQDPPYEGGARRLQQAANKVLNVKFDAVVSIRSESKDLDVNQYILSAFESADQEETYIGILKATGYDAFGNLSGVSITTSQEPTPSPAPPVPVAAPSSNNLGTTIGISVGLVLVACIGSAALAFFIVSKRRDKKPSRSNSPLSTAIDSHQGMHYADEIELGARDEVSTLGDPIPPGMRYGDVCEGGTMFTAATDGLSTDYDFQKAFHRSQISLDSTVGDSEINSGFIPKDSMSLDEEYLRKNQFEVEAPAGLLGLVIDTCDEGLPTIRAIKDTSCLIGQVQVGDILLSVDNEDVTPMMASTVSRLISSKSQNSVRRFVFTRLESDEGMA